MADGDYERRDGRAAEIKRLDRILKALAARQAKPEEKIDDRKTRLDALAQKILYNMGMATKTTFFIAAVALAALFDAQANTGPIMSGMPAPSTKSAGGSTAVLNPADWRNCSSIDSLAYRDETVVSSELTHDAPLCRIALRNDLPVQRTIVVYANAPRAAHSQRTVMLGPNASATVSLPGVFAQESGYDSGDNSMTLFEHNPPDGGKAKAERVHLANSVGEFHSNNTYGTKIQDEVNLLLSSGIVRDSILPAFKHDFNTVELRRDAADWPRDFRAYLPFDAVCIRKDVKDALPDEARAALRAFEILGGSVVTFYGGAVPKHLVSTAETAQKQRIGDLEIRKYYTSLSDFSENHSRIPINVGKSLPVNLLVLLLAIVAFVVMPGLVFACAKRNKRLLVLVLLPGTAFALTLVVALVALVAYGTTPTLRMQSVTVLDPKSRLAVTRGQFAVFAPGNVVGDISIPSDVSLRLRGRSAERLTAEFGESCRLGGDWITPLSAAFFDFERAERRSERLDVKRTDDGGIAVANLLGVPVIDGFAQLGGNRYKLPPLAPGEQATIKGEPFGTVDTAKAPPLHETLLCKGTSYGRNWPEIMKLLENNKLVVPDGSYIVRLAGSPFFPSPLASRKTYETAEAVVVGTVPAEAGKESAK